MIDRDTQEAGKGMHTPTPWHTDKYHLYIWGPLEQMVGDSRLDDAKAECPEETGVPILRARGVGAKLPINENMDFIVTAVNSHSTLTEENARLLQENKAMREALEKIDSWLVCYPITTDADICQSIPGMHKMVSTILTQGEGK